MSLFVFSPTKNTLNLALYAMQASLSSIDKRFLGVNADWWLDGCGGEGKKWSSNASIALLDLQNRFAIHAQYHIHEETSKPSQYIYTETSRTWPAALLGELSAWVARTKTT